MEFLTVTCIKPFRGFLEIYGHKKSELLVQLNSEIGGYQPYTKRIAAPPDLHPNLEFDTIYLALGFNNNKYHRCIVREKRSNNKAIIELIDYGNDFEVDASLLLELDPTNKQGNFLLNFPPIATKYILANFFCNWKKDELKIIDSLLTKSKVPITNEQIDREHQYISLDYDGKDLATKLINSHIGMEISFTEQRMEMRKWTNRLDDALNESSPNGTGGSPARREKCRNLIATRPLQSAVNVNNNVITNHGKEMIQSYIAPRTSRASFPPEPIQSDTITQSIVSGRMPAFIANELPAQNIFHVVYISYVENGPNEFYVQLKSQEHILDRLANDLASIPRIELSSRMTINMSCIGMACIARYSEDQSLYRAVIHKVHTNGCRVIFVDYGNSELVKFSDLYEIPVNFLEYKTFAMPFELHNCESLEPIDNRLKKTFSALVTNVVMELKVIPKKNSPVQQCELYLPDGKNVLDILKHKKTELNSFRNPPHLKDGDFVVIRYAVNAKKVFVQRAKDLPAFEHMMDLLLATCIDASPITILPAKDTCCAAMFNNDNHEWYRVVVLERIDAENVQVYLVDYGSTMKCHLSGLREITSRFLELPRQAIQCCLSDFENVPEVDVSTGEKIGLLITNANQELIHYKATIRHRLPNSTYVVDLYNEERDLNVSLSIYKLTMPRRVFNSKIPSKTIVPNEVEKPPRAAKANNWQNMRECDGAENQEKFIETNNDRLKEQQQFVNKERQTDDNARYERSQRQQPRTKIDINKQSNMNNGSPKNYSNRPEYDNRRNSDMNKKPILQKHIIPRFNKRSNRSRNNGKRMIGIDKNENWNGSGLANSSGFQSSDTSRISPKKINNNNNNNNNNNYNNNNNNNNNNKNNNNTVNNSNSKPSIPLITTNDFVGFNSTLPDTIPVPLNSSAKVNVVDWRSPHEFYVQLKSMDSKCDEMMFQIQKYYQKCGSIQTKVPVGALILVKHKADGVIKRARVLEYNAQREKYRVQLIDYGSKFICQLSEMYEMEKSFTRLPAMAMCCSLGNMILNRSVLDIYEKVYPYIESAEEIECTVIAQDQNKLIVDLMVKRNTDLINLKNLLVQENFLTNLPKDINLDRLIGQILTVFIAAVTDLTHFQAILYGCDIAFMCSYKDLSLVKKNPQLTDYFRKYENKYVNVKIESVGADNILNMSIYLSQLDFDEKMPEICPYPIYNNEFDCMVTEIESSNVLYVQKFTDKADTLLQQLFDAYENDTSVCESLQLNKFYVALSTDTNFYRCQIEKMYPNNMVTVRWIDYGNTETIPKSHVKELSEQFKSSTSILARKMFVPIKYIAENATLSIFDWSTEKGIKILGSYRNNFICDFISNGTSLIDTLQQKGMAHKISMEKMKEIIEMAEQDLQSLAIEKTSSEGILNQPDAQQLIEQQQPVVHQPIEEQQSVVHQPIEQSQPQSTIQQQSVAEQLVEQEKLIESIQVPEPANVVSKEAETTQTSAELNVDNLVFITHVDDPNHFYIQFDSDNNAIASFHETLQIVAPQLPALSDFRVGQLCIGKYSMDDQWYRAKIIDSDGEITSIQFIDYGNTDTITDNTLLKSIIDEDLIAKKPFAMACSLPVSPRGSCEWAESANRKLHMLTNESPMIYELVSKDKDVNYVKLFLVDGRDLVKELIQEESAEPLEIIKTGETCFVSHINSLSDFFIQVDSDTEVLHKIELHLSTQTDSEMLDAPIIGTICSAHFEDGCFYRARILNILSDNNYEVEFLDYGNTFQTKKIRSLNPEIAQLPYLRKRCTLKMPNDVDRWSEEAEEKFIEMSGDGLTKFKVSLIKPGKNACIELYINDQNVTDILGELCVKRPATPVSVVVEDIVQTKEAPTSPQQHSINISDFPSGKQICSLTHVESPADFYVQFHSKSNELNVIQTELMNDQDELQPDDVNVGSVVAALFPDDGYYYRGKVLEKTSNGTVVKFIDYGNTSAVKIIRKLSSIISTIVPLAVQCTLSNERLAQFTSDEVQAFMDFMVESEEPTFQAEAISTPTVNNKTTVTLYRNDMEILDYIRQKNVANTTLMEIIEQAIKAPH